VPTPASTPACAGIEYDAASNDTIDVRADTSFGVVTEFASDDATFACADTDSDFATDCYRRRYQIFFRLRLLRSFRRRYRRRFRRRYRRSRRSRNPCRFQRHADIAFNFAFDVATYASNIATVSNPDVATDSASDVYNRAATDSASDFDTDFDPDAATDY